MTTETISRDSRLKALAERSSYVENVLRHAFIAELSSVAWSRNPNEGLQVFNAEVDDAGFDVVLNYKGQIRYVQLKQAHAGKVPAKCSVRLSFSEMPDSCVVLLSHSVDDLKLTNFRFYGGTPGLPMPSIAALHPTKAPGRRNAKGERKVRTNYRDVPIKKFSSPLSAEELLVELFPRCEPMTPEISTEDNSGLAVMVSRIPPGAKSRAWTLREDNESHFHNVVDLRESPLYLNLSWRPDSAGPVSHVGIFKLDLPGLLRSGFLRHEPVGGHGTKVRLRIKHARSGNFLIQTQDGKAGQRLPGAKL